MTARKTAPAKPVAKSKTQQRGSSSVAEPRPTPGGARSTRAPASKTAKPKKKASALPREQTPWEKWSADPERAIADLCGAIVSGGHMAEYCKKGGLSYTSMLRWLSAEPTRSELYARAREDRSDKLADEIVAISDESQSDTYIDDEGNERTNHEVVARAKLRVDARKWVAAKLKPKVYGDKLDLTQTVTIKDLPDDELMARAARLQALLAGNTQ